MVTVPEVATVPYGVSVTLVPVAVHLMVVVVTLFAVLLVKLSEQFALPELLEDEPELDEVPEVEPPPIITTEPEPDEVPVLVDAAKTKPGTSAETVTSNPTAAPVILVFILFYEIKTN